MGRTARARTRGGGRGEKIGDDVVKHDTAPTGWWWFSSVTCGLDRFFLFAIHALRRRCV